MEILFYATFEEGAKPVEMVIEVDDATDLTANDFDIAKLLYNYIDENYEDYDYPVDFQFLIL